MNTTTDYKYTKDKTTDGKPGIKIKICGLSRSCDVDFVNEAGADFAGFVFAASRRRVLPTTARQLRDRLDAAIPAVGVFVNAPIGDIRRLAADGIVQYVQLHGQEDDAYIADLKAELTAVRATPIIKAIRVDAPEDVARALRWPVDFLLFDNGVGGTGQSFNWSWLRAADRPYFLAGGVNADNVQTALAFRPFALDISSGVETDGAKDRTKILQFVRRVRET